MLKLKTAGDSGTEININAAHVIAFRPSDDAGTKVLVTGGLEYAVTDSCRTVRHQMKKALASTPDAE